MLEFSDVAIAPVFLLYIGAILAVITNRLGRIIGAWLTFFLGLVWFLREIYVATVSLRIGAR